MANRYCNLVGSKKISEDFNNINIGFDAVQKDMDAKSPGDHRHPNATDQVDGFMSAADKAKMDASTASATPGTLVQRDASGRMKAAAPSAKTDVARKAEVDAVQSDLDSHKADTVMHVTEADHEKLGSIEEGAEVNQPAFSKVNDIEASEKTDALTFKGGVGIKITTNPTTKEVTFTSIGESTPGDHGRSHTEYGADPIPVATKTEGGLMSSADKAEFDKLAVEVPKQGAELERQGTQLKEHAAELEDHEQRIDGVEADMANVSGKPLELQPGLQVVESEQDTPFRMGEIKGRTEIHENAGIANVKNPYAIVTGCNLLPPFYEWETWMGGGDSYTTTNPYSITINALGTGGSFARYYVPAIKNETYTLSIQKKGDNAVSYMYLCRSDKNRIDNVKYTESVTTTEATDLIEVVVNTLKGNEAALGVVNFWSPMLTVGTEPKPFTPQQRSMLAFETELAAHPVDGSNPDMLFMGDDGLPYVLEPWKKVTLDGSHTWLFSPTFSGTGFKAVYVENFSDAVSRSGIISKYDGTLLNLDASLRDADTQNGILVGSPSRLFITIANSDSGWGADYNPTQDEIKAYFLGYRMCPADDAGKQYTSGPKAWVYANQPVGTGETYGVTTTTPTNMNTWNGYTPYRLQYLKAKPTVEPVRNYELGATLTAGSNMVEVGSGIVIREKAIPAQGGNGDWGINITSLPASLLNHKAATINQVYKRGVDHQWVIVTRSDGSAYGKQRASISNDDFDPTAVYHVTYTMLDPTLAAPINGTVAANLRGTVSDLVQDVGDVQRRLSVVETQKAEKDAAVVWVDASLQNGWVNYGGSFNSAGYSKDDKGVVRLRGLIKSGTVGAVVAFMLPSGFRPMKGLIMSTATYSTASAFGAIEVKSNGAVHVISGGTVYVSLEGISFTAEQ